MADQDLDQGKRRFLLTATTVATGVAAGAAAVPLVVSMMPSERAKAAGAPVEVDISDLAPGQMKVVEWRGKPVWIVRRTPDMLKMVKADEERVADPTSKRSDQPQYAKNEYRAVKPEYLVVVGICTHLGCSPDKRLAAGGASGLGEDWLGGFFCPCHGSKFDLAGRVYRGSPAPTNLVVPPHRYLSEGTILVGDDGKA